VLKKKKEKKEESMANERPQATDNSMQLLNLHQTNGNGNQITQFYIQYTTKNPIS